MVGTLIRAIRAVCSNSGCNPRRIVPVLIDLRDLEGELRMTTPCRARITADPRCGIQRESVIASSMHCSLAI